MQTPSLPIQISSASASPAPTRAASAPNPDAGQFSQALSRQIEQRQQGAAPAAPSAPAAVNAKAPAKSAESKADNAESAEAAPVDESSDDAADAAAATPVAELLTLVASFNQPRQDAAPPLREAAALAGAGATPAQLLAAARQVTADGALDRAGAPPAELLAAAGQRTADGALDSAAAPPADGAPRALFAQAARAAHEDSRAPARAGGEAPALKTDPAAAPLRAAPADSAPLAQLRGREGAEPAALKELPPAPALGAPVQQASLAVAQAMAAPASDRIAARVGTPGWDNQLSQKIVWMVAGKEQSASLTLNPPDLGPMQVVLSVSNDQASVTFSSAQPEVRQALENAMPRLREMMGENGIALGNTSVNAGMPEQRQSQGEQPRPGNAPGRFDSGSGTADPSAPRSARATGGALGLVDTFA